MAWWRSGNWMRLWRSDRDVVGGDAEEGLVAGQEPVLDHVDGDLDGGLAAALAGASLEHKEVAGLDGELDILHVVEMLFEVSGEALQFLIDVGHLAFKGVDALWGPDARHQILALGHGQIFSERGPGRRCSGSG